MRHDLKDSQLIVELEERIALLEANVAARDARIAKLTARVEQLERALATPYTEGHRRFRGQIGQG